MILTIDEERAFDKIQHQLMIKILSKVGLEGTYLNIIKAIYDEPTANITQQAKTSIPLKSRNKTGMSAFISLIQQSTGSASHNDQTSIQIRKEEVKLSLFAET